MGPVKFEGKQMVTIVVDDKGNKRYNLGSVGLPVPKARKVTEKKAAVYPFNDMNVAPGENCNFWVSTRAEVAAATQAFMSKRYETARDKGKLMTKNVKKHPDLIGPKGEEFCIWLVERDADEQAKYLAEKAKA